MRKLDRMEVPKVVENNEDVPGGDGEEAYPRDDGEQVQIIKRGAVRAKA